MDDADGGERTGDGTAGAGIEDVTVAAAGDRQEIVGIAGRGKGVAGEGDDGGEGRR